MLLNDYLKLNNAIVTFDGERGNGRFLVITNKDLDSKTIPVAKKAQNVPINQLSVFKTDTNVIIAFETVTAQPDVIVQVVEPDPFK